MRNDIRVGFFINGKHTYHDYGLYLSEPPDFGSPDPKTEYLEVPGRDGVLDYSEAATGEIKYSNRQMKFTFATEIKRNRREQLRSDLRSDLHGRTAEIIYDLDSDWYYTGRCTVDFEDVETWKMKVVIAVDAAPYKLARDLTTINATPTSYAAEVVFLGMGTEQQHINSIFTFGTASDPLLDLTKFSTITFVWDASADIPIGTPLLQIVDADGETYNSYTGSNTDWNGNPAMELDVSEITGIDQTSVYRILCAGRPLVRLHGTTTASASFNVSIDRMTVVPIWTASKAVRVYVDAKGFSLPEGKSQNYDITIPEGDHKITFYSDSDGGTYSVQYRDGRL